jgi:dienelactone hydrolase
MKKYRLALAALAASVCVHAVAAGLRDEMRQPWQRDDTGYLRHWLALSPFECDLPTECVPDEGALQPVDGAEQKLADGTSLKWHVIESWGDWNTPDTVSGKARISYAATTIHRDKAGKARLSIGTDDGVRVWVNGRRVLARDGRRNLDPDEDQVDVDLAAGDNTLLVKIVAANAFAVRVLEAGAVAARRTEISPAVIEMQPESFTVRTDATRARADADEVQLSVIAPGGEVKFSSLAKRGELVVVDARGWPDGPYDVKASTLNAQGLRYTAWRDWYKGNSLVKARELARVAAQADASQPEGFTLQMLAAMVDDRLGMKLAEATGNPWTKLHSPLMEFDEIMLERAGKVGRVRAGGFVRLAWRDPVDDTPQYCRAYLPNDYDSARKWPALLQLHGYNPANPDYVGWWGVDGRHSGPETEFSGHRTLIYIEPHGRGNTQYRALGDADVLKCLAEAKRLFSIDDNRVYLSGESMGGWGTWNVATRHPDLFAAIAPVFGGADHHAQMKEEELAALTPVESFLMGRDSTWAFAESLNNMPILVHHGDADKSVNVDWTRWGVRLLQRWGYDVRYIEYPGRGHEVLTWSNALMSAEFFLSHVRDPNPRRVRMHTTELRNGRAYWVRIGLRERPLSYMDVDAEVVDRNVIRLDTRNVAAITLSPGPLVDAAKPVRVVWNGVAHDMALAAGELQLDSCACESTRLRKTPALPGSSNDFFNTPFAVVVGTSSKDARMRTSVRASADSFVSGWKQWQKFPPRVFLDTEISDADLAKYSLLLVGGADANRVTAKLASALPLRVARHEIALDGHAFAVDDAAVQMLYPNPRNRSRYVWVFAATSGDALGYAVPNQYRVSEWDYLIADGHAPPAGQNVMAERTRVVSGMFDENWRYDAALADLGDAALRAAGRRFAVPKGALPDAKLVAELVGKYQIEFGPLIDLQARDGALSLVANGEASPVALVDGLTFYATVFDLWMTFTRDAAGRINGINGWNGSDFSAQRAD